MLAYSTIVFLFTGSIYLTDDTVQINTFDKQRNDNRRYANIYTTDAARENIGINCYNKIRSVKVPTAKCRGRLRIFAFIVMRWS